MADERLRQIVPTNALRILVATLCVLGTLRSGEKKTIGLGQESAPSGPMVMTRINGPIILDGLSNEPAWRGISPLSFIQIEPNAGAGPSEQTEVLIAYDDDYLYMAGRLFDHEPEKIYSNSKQRDSGNPSCEWFGIVVDSFNDKENALAFFTTPAGLRWDAAVFNDAQGEEPINLSWNTFWDVATARNGEGWFAEFRIPFSSLRFQERDGRVVMGIIIWRQIARKNEWAIFPAIPPDWGFWSKFKPSRAQEFVLAGVTSRRPVYVTPYALGGIGQTAELSRNETGYMRKSEIQRQAGLDLKYGFSSHLTLDVTLNPDFAQVEADDQQVNLTRFSLFFPEKRLFFQERASIFDFSFEISDQNYLFYSRRIGIDEGGLVGIYGGVRIVARAGPWDLGFLDMQTSGREDSTSENMGVLRLRRQVINPYSYVGGMVTSRIGRDGKYNVAYGLDGVLRVFGDDYLTLKWAQTFSTGKNNNPFSRAPSRYYLNWLRRSNRGLGYGLSYSGSGADYEPGLGFQRRENYTRYVASVWHGWYPGEKSALFNHIVELDAFLFIRNGENKVETLTIGPNWRFSTKTGYACSITPNFHYESVPATFSLSDLAQVPRGEYRFFDLNVQFSTPSRRPWAAETSFTAGSFYDGRRISAGLGPNWSVLPDLQLNAFYELNRVAFPGRGQSFTAHVARLRALYMLTTKFSASAFVQYNSAANAVIGNVRVRYNPREGVDFYLVYNETLNADRNRQIPRLPLSSDRALMVKYSYTFDF